MCSELVIIEWAYVKDKVVLSTTAALVGLAVMVDQAVALFSIKSLCFLAGIWSTLVGSAESPPRPLITTRKVERRHGPWLNPQHTLIVDGLDRTSRISVAPLTVIVSWQFLMSK